MKLLLSLMLFLVASVAMDRSTFAQWQPIPLKHTIDSVAPWTGIVLWTDNDQNHTDAVQLEYSYMQYNKVALDRGVFDWSPVDELLEEVASRGHQAVLRFYFVYPGKPTAVPRFIQDLAEYKKITGQCEGKKTGFVDWSHPAIGPFTMDFYTAFAKRYDTDPRLAYLQTGFGLWGEYHLYEGPLTGAKTLGKIFPSKVYQRKFVKHLDAVFDQTPWMISVDGDYSPFEEEPQLLRIPFGVFDDSFLCKPHPKENAWNWRFFGKDRWKHSPGGGEFSYYTNRDQKKALSASGPHGRSFQDSAAEFHVSHDWKRPAEIPAPQANP